MATARYLPQVPDSLKVTPQADTVQSSAVQQPSTTLDTIDSAVVKPVMLRPAATTTNVVPKALTQVIQQEPVKARTVSRVWNSNSNFFSENGLSGIVKPVNKLDQKDVSAVQTGTVKPPEIVPQQRNLGSHDWVLGIILLLVLLFIWIRIFYSKFFATLGSALISFQIAAKLFREKNVLLHRVSLVLDFIYVIVFSLFIFELVTYFKLPQSTMNGLKLFLLLLNIMILYVILRTVVLRFTGTLFLIRSVFAEYIHNTLVVNKGMGIALFPVVIMVQYFPHQLTPVILTIGVLVIGMAFILKSFRAYQIIIRKDILLFYLILYLCTLEILPLLLGYKFVTSLI